MIFDLPNDLTHALLSVWLELVDLARLDAASTNLANRGGFLAMLKDIVFDSDQYPEDFYTLKRSFYRWIWCREFRLRHLVLSQNSFGCSHRYEKIQSVIVRDTARVDAVIETINSTSRLSSASLVLLDCLDDWNFHLCNWSRCRSLRHINIEGCDDLGVGGIYTLAYCCNLLERVRIKDNRRLDCCRDDHALTMLVNNNPHISHLKVLLGEQLSLHRVLATIAEVCLGMVYVHLRGIFRGEHLSAIVARNRNRFERFRIDYNIGGWDTFYFNTTANPKRHRNELLLTGWNSSELESFVLANNRGLAALDLKSVDLREDVIHSIIERSRSTLKWICFNGEHISPDLVRSAVRHCERLEHLRLQVLTFWRDNDYLDVFQSRPSALSCLQICFATCLHTSTVVKIVKLCSQLRVLSVEGCELVEEQRVQRFLSEQNSMNIQLSDKLAVVSYEDSDDESDVRSVIQRSTLVHP